MVKLKGVHFESKGFGKSGGTSGTWKWRGSFKAKAASALAGERRKKKGNKFP